MSGQSIASGSDVMITDVGETAANAALICLTDVPNCCRSVDGNRQGEWTFPNGSLVEIPGAGRDFYRNRNTRVVLLQRRNNALGPLGAYCCKVEAVDDPDAIVCINLSK